MGTATSSPRHHVDLGGQPTSPPAPPPPVKSCRVCHYSVGGPLVLRVVDVGVDGDHGRAGVDVGVVVEGMLSLRRQFGTQVVRGMRPPPLALLRHALGIQLVGRTLGPTWGHPLMTLRWTCRLCVPHMCVPMQRH